MYNHSFPYNYNIYSCIAQLDETNMFQVILSPDIYVVLLMLG